tara:strand:+ start:5595 stop:6305 length:711 start_codon:yes stop_codon:yes gene_type:complete
MEVLDKYTDEFENQQRLLKKYKKEHKNTIDLAKDTHETIKSKAKERREKVAKKVKELTGYVYKTYDSQAVKGHNKKTIKNTDVNTCKKECNKEEWCKGFEFHKKDKYCHLDEVGPNSKGWQKNKKYNYFEKKEKEKEHEIIEEGEPDVEEKPKVRTFGTSFLTMFVYVKSIFILSFLSIFALSISMNCTNNSHFIKKAISNCFAFFTGILYLMYYFIVRVLILQKPCKMDHIKFFC